MATTVINADILGNAATATSLPTTSTQQFTRIGVGGAADATHLTTVTGGTVTADTQVFNSTQTWNNSGVTFTGIKYTVTNTSSNSASKLIEFFVGAGSVFALRVDGLLTLGGGVQAGGSIISASTSRFGFGLTRAQMDSPADSRIRLMNANLDNFSRLTLGLETSAFPALKRNGTAVNFRLGDDSADAPITVGALTASGTTTLATSLTGVLKATSGVVSVDATIVSNNFTPSATNVTNITSSTPNNATYERNGSIVTVYGSITVTNTLAVASEVDVSLPVASNFSAATDLNGVATMDSTASVNIYIKADATNDRASIFFTSAGVGQTSTIYYTYQYKVI